MPAAGLATKEGLAPANKVGVIDPDYRGEVLASLFNQSNITRIITPSNSPISLYGSSENLFGRSQ